MNTSPPEGWVPVEHRFLGLDRRQFRPALFVLVVGLVLIYGFQGLNALIPWDNPTKAGDVLALGNGATVVPPVGWQLEDGTLVGDGPGSTDVTLVKGGATIHLQGGAFTGTATAFLDQVRRVEERAPAVTGPRASFTTDAGLVGVVQTESGPRGEGLDAAFKLAAGAAADTAPALLVEVAAAPGEFEQDQDEIGAFLRSIKPEERA
ncbi:hypothetical protein [Cryptosporangium arvum]|uniref:hypothetical protein n=1 Tax=Cryptosporangium arvum TaxID=80871 RepID=UPI0004AC972C|nr:hypothetical protein [Cryptosporangium arvum]